MAVIENCEFRDLLPKEVDPPCRKIFTEVCLYTCFENTKEKLLSDIDHQSTKYIGIQVDHTTASNYTPYGNMCVQYVNDDFTLCAVSVGAFKYEDRHTAEDLYSSCEGTNGLVKEWHLGNFKRV